MFDPACADIPVVVGATERAGVCFVEVGGRESTTARPAMITTTTTTMTMIFNVPEALGFAGCGC